MLTAKQRASVEKALATDPKRKPPTPAIAALLDWLEERALHVSNVRRTSADQLTAELAFRVERERERLAVLVKADKDRVLPGVPHGHRFRLRNGSQMRERVQLLDRAAASLWCVQHARVARAKGDADALAFCVLMAERSLRDPASERAERARRERLSRLAVRGGRSRGKPVLSRDADLQSRAGDLARRHPLWSNASIAKRLAKPGSTPSAKRIEAIIAPVVRKLRGTTPD